MPRCPECGEVWDDDETGGCPRCHPEDGPRQHAALALMFAVLVGFLVVGLWMVWRQYGG